MIIVIETKNGSAFPKKAFACNDEADFIQRIRDTQLQQHSCDDLVETVEDACSWLNERHAQNTDILTRDEFENTERWSSVIDECAYKAGWLALNKDEQVRYDEFEGNIMNENSLTAGCSK